MNFDMTIRVLSNKMHPLPEAERDKVIEILTNGKGYLTKDKPIRVVFFDDNAGE